jgi:hypothetical protein
MPAIELPSRFPVGTRYVIEGKPGKKGELHIVSRQLIMPDGQAIELKAGIVSFDRPRAAATRLKQTRRVSRTKKA